MPQMPTVHRLQFRLSRGIIHQWTVHSAMSRSTEIDPCSAVVALIPSLILRCYCTYLPSMARDAHCFALSMKYSVNIRSQDAEYCVFVSLDAVQSRGNEHVNIRATVSSCLESGTFGTSVVLTLTELKSSEHAQTHFDNKVRIMYRNGKLFLS